MSNVGKRAISLIFIGIWVLFFLIGELFAQGKEFSANGFGGLELDQSSSEDVIKALGLLRVGKKDRLSNPLKSKNGWLMSGRSSNSRN